jgi:NAD-dependent SIR2 family protein deacetylase/Tfp pilus assembly protein PilF
MRHQQDENIIKIAEAMRQAKGRDKRTMLFVGAGCSVSAGIPAAGIIVKEIIKQYPAMCGGLSDKSYSTCMGNLDNLERRNFINKYIDAAKINWAHIAIAQLMKNGYVDRVLTTNFDPLVIRACAMVGVFPAVYDFAISQDYDPDIIHPMAVLYLQGQYTGVRQQHTYDETAGNKVLDSIIEREGEGRHLIVVGYSGESDPLVECLVKQAKKSKRLYWVCYKEENPCEAIEKTIKESKFAEIVMKDYDADSFFVMLARELRCFPPEFVEKPFSSLKEQLETLTDFVDPEPDPERGSLEILKKANEDIGKAISIFEEGKTDNKEDKDSSTIKSAMSAYMAGDYERVCNLVSDTLAKENEQMAEIKAWSMIFIGNKKRNQANEKQGVEADRLYKEAGEKYEQAQKIKPDIHQAPNDWGIALSQQAERKEGIEADRLFTEACEKYEQALKIKPDMYHVINNWGLSLIARTKKKEGIEADRLLNDAEEKFQKTEKIEEGKGAYNLACIYAIRRNEEDCKKWLELSRDKGALPNRKHIEEDEDLEFVRDKKWFKDILDGLNT